MQRNSKEYIDQLNKQIRRRELLNVAYSFLNKKRVKENKNKLMELENKLILEKLKNAL